jgi:G3E family GTPase
MMILNKVDLAGAEQVKKAQAWTHDHFTRLRIVETSYCDAQLEILLAVGRFDPTRTVLDRQALEYAGGAEANCGGTSIEPKGSSTFRTRRTGEQCFVVGKRVDITLEMSGTDASDTDCGHRRGRQYRYEADGRDFHLLHLGGCRKHIRMIKAHSVH